MIGENEDLEELRALIEKFNNLASRTDELKIRQKKVRIENEKKIICNKIGEKIGKIPIEDFNYISKDLSVDILEKVDLNVLIDILCNEFINDDGNQLKLDLSHRKSINKLLTAIGKISDTFKNNGKNEKENIQKLNINLGNGCILIDPNNIDKRIESVLILSNDDLSSCLKAMALSNKVAHVFDGKMQSIRNDFLRWSRKLSSPSIKYCFNKIDGEIATIKDSLDKIYFAADRSSDGYVLLENGYKTLKNNIFDNFSLSFLDNLYDDLDELSDTNDFRDAIDNKLNVIETKVNDFLMHAKDCGYADGINIENEIENIEMNFINYKESFNTFFSEIKRIKEIKRDNFNILDFFSDSSFENFISWIDKVKEISDGTSLPKKTKAKIKGYLCQFGIDTTGEIDRENCAKLGINLDEITSNDDDFSMFKKIDRDKLIASYLVSKYEEGRKQLDMQNKMFDVKDMYITMIGQQLKNGKFGNIEYELIKFNDDECVNGFSYMLTINDPKLSYYIELHMPDLIGHSLSNEYNLILTQSSERRLDPYSIGASAVYVRTADDISRLRNALRLKRGQTPQDIEGRRAIARAEVITRGSTNGPTLEEPSEFVASDTSSQTVVESSGVNDSSVVASDTSSQTVVESSGINDSSIVALEISIQPIFNKFLNDDTTSIIGKKNIKNEANKTALILHNENYPSNVSNEILADYNRKIYDKLQQNEKSEFVVYALKRDETIGKNRLLQKIYCGENIDTIAYFYIYKDCINHEYDIASPELQEDFYEFADEFVDKKMNKSDTNIKGRKSK